MKAVDAPPAGWYPDPSGRARLRWWDGSDWTEAYRPPPTATELARSAPRAPDAAATVTPASPGRPLSRADVETVMSEVRQVAREEVGRGVDLVTQRATTTARQFQPLVTEYTNRVLRWLKIIAIVVAVTLIGWVVFEAVAGATFLEWLGDRIDAVTD